MVDDGQMGPEDRADMARPDIGAGALGRSAACTQVPPLIIAGTYVSDFFQNSGFVLARPPQTERRPT